MHNGTNVIPDPTQEKRVIAEGVTSKGGMILAYTAYSDGSLAVIELGHGPLAVMPDIEAAVLADIEHQRQKREEGE